MLGNRRARLAAAGGIALAGLVVPPAWAAGPGPVERRVHRPDHNHTVVPRATSGPTGLSPAKVKQAYNFPTSPTAGAGQTVAIVIPFDNPKIEADLNAFSKKFGLPACTTANKCFKKVDQKGGKHYPAADTLWALESALDVEWAHAIAPGAKILLVEARSDHLSDVMAAEDYAGAHARYVSNSLGVDEFPGETAYDSHLRRPGVSIFVASGDEGAAGGAGYPAASPAVIAVGGTTLTGIGQPSFAETAWKGSGGGCSGYETAAPAQAAAPGYANLDCAGKRAVPDVALVADPRSGVSVYYSYKTTKPWTVLGGTSASTPMWAARAAVSGRVITPDLLYGPSSPINFRDVTSGTNGFPALTGLDLVTGLGSWTGRTP
ncbi:MAG TPA: S53 family peptidase [Acidimicrobiia bacterium]|nr:S53 family peptidase [Acidimicrobiia bacterium]